MIATKEHGELWDTEAGTASSATQVRVPIARSGKHWATLEVRFESKTAGGAVGLLESLWQRTIIRLLLLVGSLGFTGYWIYMRRTLRHLDPSAVIPTRVQAALDVMSEGVVLLDPQGRIVLSNEAFAARSGRSAESLLGAQLSELEWQRGAEARGLEFPWWEALREGRISTGTALSIEREPGDVRILLLNVSPILDGWGKPKGAIATFDDVTELEHKKAALEEAMTSLEKSRDEIQLQNQELELLAKKDPLTGLANRRSFMEWFEMQFSHAQTEGLDLQCIMADIDHFKQVNDTHGHAAGDEVIQRVSELLSSAVRNSDAVCRYGGEEFCIVLPGASKQTACDVANRLCQNAHSPGFARVPISVSFGTASIRSGSETIAVLLDQADKALYASKEAGRDRVTSWEDIST
jgi:diguanylate cyclase (GGDEF)-like protein/PAS domain S-box-containing protein